MASRFWVGGTGTWDASDTTHWAASSNGAGGQSVPVAADTVTFDGSSGGGTVTVNHASLSITSLTMGAHTGTIDFATNDNNITVGTVSNNSSGTRTLNMGDGTWTVTGTGNVWLFGGTNGTVNCNASTVSFTGNPSSMSTMTLGGFTYNIFSIGANSNRGGYSINTGTTPTIATFNIAAPNIINWTAPATVNITNALTLTGTNSAAIDMRTNTFGTAITLALGAASTGTWVTWRDMTNTGNSLTLTNSIDLGRNTFTGGGSISAPSAGGGGVVGVIGG